MRKFSAAAAVAVFVGVGAATSFVTVHAEEPARAAGPRMPVTAANVEQKSKFVTNLIANSASARAIESSDDAEAKEAVKTARTLAEEASADITGGRLAEADEKLNRAVDLMMAQTRKVSLGNMKDSRAKQLYESKLGSVKALVEAYDRVSKEKGTANRNERRSAISLQLVEIEKHAAAGNYETAVTLLDKAYSAVSVDVAGLREGDKLKKDLSFASPEEEYVYEIDRNDSHQYLLKMALSEKPPNEMYVAQISGMRTQAEELRKAAEARGEAKDFTGGIKTLGDSTQLLIKALRMAGAYIPG
ncbi:MAG: hypothetical protein H7840_06875 [Alphaproteobacteria bacterium]